MRVLFYFLVGPADGTAHPNLLQHHHLGGSYLIPRRDRATLQSCGGGGKNPSRAPEQVAQLHRGDRQVAALSRRRRSTSEQQCCLWTLSFRCNVRLVELGVHFVRPPSLPPSPTEKTTTGATVKCAPTYRAIPFWRHCSKRTAVLVGAHEHPLVQ